MELTSCACVRVPVACETQLRMFDLVFPCVRELRCSRTLDLLSAWSFRGVVVSIWIPSLLRVALLHVLQTSQLAFRRRLLCPFVLGALKQRCPRNIPNSVCVCVLVSVLCCGCFGFGFAPLSCLGAISVVGCWNT